MELKVIQSLPVKLTQEEIVEAAKSLAKTTNELRDCEAKTDFLSPVIRECSTCIAFSHIIAICGLKRRPPAKSLQRHK